MLHSAMLSYGDHPFHSISGVETNFFLQFNDISMVFQDFRGILRFGLVVL